MRWAKMARVRPERLQGVGVSIAVPLLEQWEPPGFGAAGGHNQTLGLRVLGNPAEKPCGGTGSATRPVRRGL